MSSPQNNGVKTSLVVRRAKAIAAVISAAITMVVLGLSACSNDKKESAVEETSQLGVPEVAIFTLSEGKKSLPEREKVAQNTTALPDDARTKLIGRLPELKEGGASDFKLPEATLQPLPPKSGTTEQSVFPPPQGSEDKGPKKPIPRVEPLKILRHVPEGNVAKDTTISITFSQPMVPVTTVGQVASKIPVTLTPMPQGEWKWLGTETLAFVPDKGSLPGSTLFEVDVPAGITSSTGTKLDSEFRWSFQTPVNRVVEWFPTGSGVARDTTMIAVLTQPVDQESFLKKLIINDYEFKKNSTRLQLVPAAEARKDPKLKAFIEHVEADPNKRYWVAFKAAEPFPSSLSVVTSIPAGLDSTEGPLTSDQPFSNSFYTYGPLNLSQCDAYSGRPKSMYVRFTNALKPETVKEKSIEIKPPVDFHISYAYDSSMQLQGAFKSNTQYTIKVKDFEDIYGQKIEGNTGSARFGNPEPYLDSQYGGIVTLQRSENSIYTIKSAGLTSVTAQIYAANPSIWRTYQEHYWDDTFKGAQLLNSKTFKLDPSIDDLETPLDLKPFLKNGYGNLILKLQSSKPHDYKSTMWIQFTDMGVDAFSDHKNVQAWITRLQDGKPLSDVQVSAGSSSARTNAKGLAWLKGSNTQLVIARRGDDVAMLPGYWRNYSPEDVLVWYGASDRGLYKPGEQLKAKGFVRQRGYGPKARLVSIPGTGLSVRYTVEDSRSNQIAKGTAAVDSQGGFDLSFKVPTNANLGQARANLYLERNGQTEGRVRNVIGYLTFDVQAFRRPEFDMKVTDLQPRSLLLGEKGTLQASAHYYSGGALGETPIKWTVRATPGHFAPAGWEDYQFAGGEYKFLREKEGVSPENYGQSQIYQSWPLNMFDISNARLTKTFDGSTDYNGEHVLDVNVAKLSHAVPLSFEVEGTVEDKTRQSWTDKQTLLFHPANVYVGLKNQSYFVEQGQPLDLSAIVTDLDGKVVSGKKVDLEIFRETYVQKDNKYTTQRKSIAQKSLNSAADPVKLNVDATKDEGDYIVVATVHDDDNRASKTELRVWCMGAWSHNDGLEQSQAKLMADKKEYAPGETANIMVMSPFAPFNGLLNVRRQGFVQTINFESDKNSCVVKVPVDEDFVSGASVEVELVGNKPVNDPDEKIDNNNKNDARASSNKSDASANETMPAYAIGYVNLAVPPKHHALRISVTPAESKLQPGGETSVNLLVKNSKDNPVSGSEVAVAVVDESVLALSGYRIQTPLDSFYNNQDPGVTSVLGRNNVQVAPRTKKLKAAHYAFGNSRGFALGGGGGGYYTKAPMLQGATNGTVGSMAECDAFAATPAPRACPALAGRTHGFLDTGTQMMNYNADKQANGGGSPQPKITMRSNFDALATFVPVAITDKTGNATIKVKLPDSLTRYRIMAIAAAGAGEFGKGESTLVAQLPLMVKPSLPRFLRFGDITELPVMVHNQTDKPLTVDVALRGSNIELMEKGKRVTVNGNDRVEVRFKANANQAGTSTLQVVASSGNFSDASEQSLPVYTPATTEAFATYGVIDGNKVILQPIEKPKNVFDQFGDVEITTSSTALQSLTDAYHYLEDYDYACSEQLSSRLLSMLALRDVMAAFKTQSSKDKATTTKLMNDDIRLLLSRQRSKGDFGLWKENDKEDWPYVSIQVTRALIVAKQKGFNVPQEPLNRALNYLRNVENYIDRHDYSDEAIRTLQCYAQYVLNMTGQLQVEEARMLLAKGLNDIKPGSKNHDRQWWYGGVIDNLESAGWLVCALSNDATSKDQVGKAKRLIESRIDETASTADVLGGSYGGCNYRMFWCPKRLNAVVLEALMVNDPQNPVIPKLVNGLLGDRHKGRWESTQENFNVLLALDRYFNTYEKLTPEFRVSMWLGNSFAGKQEFKGRSTVSKELIVPMAYVTKQEKQDVTMQKDGQGRLYYRIGMRYAPKDLAVAAMDRGFIVKRTYEPVDRKSDVRQDKDGTWHIAPGAQVRVNLEMMAPSSRFHVALNDPIPAGCEISNPDLKGSKQSNDPQKWTWWWTWNWYEHQNLKDDRAEAFSSVVWGGTYKYSYIMRATTPGTYQVPPTKAEEMYTPETFGRCASDLVVIE